jgi:hypothetical protein
MAHVARHHHVIGRFGVVTGLRRQSELPHRNATERMPPLTIATLGVAAFR